MNILVVYYSRTGHTRIVAEAIARSLGAELEALGERTKRLGFRGYLSGGRDAMRHKQAELLPVQNDPANYDVVVAGSPVWAFTLCPAVRTYLSQSADALHRVAFFCTHGGGGASRSYSEAEKLIGKPLVATLALRDRAVRDGNLDPLPDFLQTLNAIRG